MPSASKKAKEKNIDNDARPSSDSDSVISDVQLSDSADDCDHDAPKKHTASTKSRREPAQTRSTPKLPRRTAAAAETSTNLPEPNHEEQVLAKTKAKAKTPTNLIPSEKVRDAAVAKKGESFSAFIWHRCEQ